MVRIRLLITSPHHPPTLEITVAAHSASSSAPASHSAVRSAPGLAVSPEGATVTASRQRPIRKGTARAAPAGWTEQVMIARYGGFSSRVNRAVRNREDTPQP